MSDLLDHANTLGHSYVRIVRIFRFDAMVGITRNKAIFKLLKSKPCPIREIHGFFLGGLTACVQADFQVILWRELCGLPRDQGLVAADSWGLKRLLSYGIRRWLAGAKAPREA